MTNRDTILKSIKANTIRNFYIVDDFGEVELWYIKEERDVAENFPEELTPFTKLIGSKTMLGVLKNPHLGKDNLEEDSAHWIPIRECLRIDTYNKWESV